MSLALRIADLCLTVGMVVFLSIMARSMYRGGLWSRLSLQIALPSYFALSVYQLNRVLEVPWQMPGQGFLFSSLGKLGFAALLMGYALGFKVKAQEAKAEETHESRNEFHGDTPPEGTPIDGANAAPRECHPWNHPQPV